MVALSLSSRGRPREVDIAIEDGIKASTVVTYFT